MIGEELGGFPEEVTSEWHLEGRISVCHTERVMGFWWACQGQGKEQGGMKMLQVDPGRLYLKARGLSKALARGRVVIRFGLEKVPVFRIEGALEGYPRWDRAACDPEGKDVG